MKRRLASLGALAIFWVAGAAIGCSGDGNDEADFDALVSFNEWLYAPAVGTQGPRLKYYIEKDVEGSLLLQSVLTMYNEDDLIGIEEFEATLDSPIKVEYFPIKPDIQKPVTRLEMKDVYLDSDGYNLTKTFEVRQEGDAPANETNDQLQQEKEQLEREKEQLERDKAELQQSNQQLQQQLSQAQAQTPPTQTSQPSQGGTSPTQPSQQNQGTTIYNQFTFRLVSSRWPNNRVKSGYLQSNTRVNLGETNHLIQHREQITFYEDGHIKKAITSTRGILSYVGGNYYHFSSYNSDTLSGTLSGTNTITNGRRIYDFYSSINFYSNGNVNNGILASSNTINLGGYEITIGNFYRSYYSSNRIYFHSNGSPFEVVTSNETIVVRGATYTRISRMLFYDNENIHYIYRRSYWTVRVGGAGYSNVYHIYFDRATSKIIAIDRNFTDYKFYLDGTVAESGRFFSHEQLLAWDGVGD